MKPEKERSGQGAPLLAIIALNLAILLQVYLIFAVITLSVDLRIQRDELATRQDVMEMVAHMTQPDPTEVILQATCVNCHTGRAFTASDMVTTQIKGLVSRMIDSSGINECPLDTVEVESALTCLKCARCHTMDQCKAMTGLSRVERWKLIIEMIRKPGSYISLEDARRINDYSGEFWSWFSP